MLHTFTIEMEDSEIGWQSSYRPTAKDLEDLLNEHGPRTVKFKVLAPGDEVKAPGFVQFQR